MLGIFSVSSPWTEISLHVNWLAHRSNTLPLLVPTGEDGIWKVWWKAISSSCGDRDHCHLCAGRQQVFWNIWWICDDRRPSRHLRGSSLQQGKDLPPPTYVVICSLWQQAGMEEVWIQSCPEFLCLAVTPRNQEPEEKKDVHLVFFFLLPLWHLVNYLSSQSLRIFVSQKFIAQSKHWHVYFFKLRWNSHNIQLTF